MRKLVEICLGSLFSNAATKQHKESIPEVHPSKHIPVQKKYEPLEAFILRNQVYLTHGKNISAKLPWMSIQAYEKKIKEIYTSEQPQASIPQGYKWDDS